MKTKYRNFFKLTIKSRVNNLFLEFGFPVSKFQKFIAGDQKPTIQDYEIINRVIAFLKEDLIKNGIKSKYFHVSRIKSIFAKESKTFDGTYLETLLMSNVEEYKKKVDEYNLRVKKMALNNFYL